MKKLILLFTIICGSFSLSASHFAGAEIGYEYLSTNSNGTHQYKLRLQIYRDVAGIPLNLNQSVCLNSSCFGQQIIALTFLPVSPQNGGNIRQALPVPDLTSCVDPNDPDMVTIEIYYFEALVTLPGNCSDFKFSWHGNARNVNAIDNLVFTNQTDLYVETVLNNTFGQNTSPLFVNPAAKSFCVGSPFTWSQAATEPDNDSLRYSFGHPLNSPAAPICVTPSQATFAPGYSRLQPMTTVSGITIDEKNGTFYFTPSQIETDVVNVMVEEYRWESNSQQWLMVGNTVRDLQIPIVGQCLESTSAGPKINTNANGFYKEALDLDSTRNFLFGMGYSKAIFDSTLSPRTDSVAVIDYQCGDSIITLSFNVDIVCSSISDNGTEFRLVGPDSAATPIPSVNYTCKTDLTTNDIALLLHQPLDVNGDYYLQIKNGDDGNTLQNECGFNLSPFYTMKIRVSGCTDPIYTLDNVTVVRDSSIQIDWSAVDSTLNEKLFTSWAIQRGRNGQFYTIDNINDFYARSFNDLSAGPDEVDIFQYDYAVQLIQNFDPKSPSNVIGNILLEMDRKTEQTNFTWNPYMGWSQPEYIIEQALVSAGAWNWQTLQGPSDNLLAYTFDHPEVDALNEGTYAFRVVANDPTGAPAYVSESNWLYLEFKNEPIVDDVPIVSGIPNVITPNGDSQNDAFYFGKNTYSNVSISIYNRWGKLIFQDLNAASENYISGKGWNGTDMNTGKPVSDGVYYYLISLNDNTSGQSEELKGPVTIMRGTH